MFMGEYMCGIAYDNPYMSNITLAWMYDSGWYFPNFNQAGVLHYGWNLGCTFADPNSCSSRGSLSPFYGCTEATQTGCTFDRSGEGPCSGLDNEYLFNGCSYYAKYSNRNSFYGASWYGGSDGSTIGLNSLCFNTGSNANTYQVYCANQDQLFLIIGTSYVYCPWGGSVVIPTYGTTVYCPAAIENVCWNTSSPSVSPGLPIISAVSPTSGGSGTAITVTGTGFTSNMTVSVCGSAASSVVIQSTQITCTVEASNDGVTSETCSVDVTQSGKTFSIGWSLSPLVPALTSNEWYSCVIATAAYGSQMDPHVWKLRNFRDQYLKQTFVGQLFVDIYYHTAPPVAVFISENEWTKPIVRAMLWPIVTVIENLF